MQLNDVLSQLSNLRKVATYFLTIAFILAVQEISAGDGWWFLPNKCSYPWPSQGNFTGNIIILIILNTKKCRLRNKISAC